MNRAAPPTGSRELLRQECCVVSVAFLDNQEPDLGSSWAAVAWLGCECGSTEKNGPCANVVDIVEVDEADVGRGVAACRVDDFAHD